VAPLAGIGPALFLHALVWQNLVWQAVLGDRSQAEAGGAGRPGRRVRGRRRRPADELTWPSHRPNRRIDYIWLSGDLAAGGFAALASTAGDHRGLAVTVRPG
jgi:endonuclease/exonuclease/phosphatase family metal-dependent hydrolase